MPIDQTYQVNGPDSKGIANTPAKQLRDQQYTPREYVDARGRKSIVDWEKLHAEFPDLSILGAAPEDSVDIWSKMMRADGAALEAKGKYITPQRPQYAGGAIMGTFPDNQLKFAGSGLTPVLQDAAVGAAFGGTGALLSALGDTRVQRTPDAQAMLLYLKTPEGVGRMAEDPHFATEVIQNYADEYRESLGLDGAGSDIGRIAKRTVGGIGKGALVGMVAGRARNLIRGGVGKAERLPV